jgi:hypothetical protein
MALNLKQFKQHAKEYVQLEANTRVIGVRFVKLYRLFGREDAVLLVRTTDKRDPDWWVIGGSTPMNLYSTKMFPEADTAYSLHHGLMLRMADQNFDESKIPPEEIGYDAFISHASEDKEKFVKPLAKALAGMGYQVIWGHHIVFLVICRVIWGLIWVIWGHHIVFLVIWGHHIVSNLGTPYSFSADAAAAAAHLRAFLAPVLALPRKAGRALAASVWAAM